MSRTPLIPSIVLIFCLCFGCTTSHFIAGDASDERTRWMSSFNEEAKDRRATIAMKDSSILTAFDVRCVIDSLSYSGVDGAGRTVLPLGSVLTVSVYNRTYGAFEGIGWGLIGAPIVSAPFLAADRDHDGLQVLTSLTVSAATGAVIGGVTGSMLEHKHVYHFIDARH